MTLTPQDIQSKQFHVRFRGFDVEEVDAFLEQVAENYSLLVEDNKSLKVQLHAVKSEIESIKGEENSFKNALVSAQRVAQEMEKKSREEASKLLTQAGDEVARLKDQALHEITELEYKVDSLRALQGKLQDELRAVIHNYLELVDNPEKIELSETESLPEASELDSEESSFQSSGILSRDDTDISDLYEKIDIAEDDPVFIGRGDDNSETDESRDADPVIAIRSDDAGQAIPDMDDDFMFTLEDPLDRQSEDKKE